MPNPDFAHPLTIRLHDTDAAGVLFYGHLFRHTQDAYEAFMAAIGLPLDGLIRDGCWLPLVHAEADYLIPMRHGDRFGVEVAVAALGESSYSISYGFRDGAGALRARARTVHVHLGPDRTGSAPLPEGLRSALVATLGTQ